MGTALNGCDLFAADPWVKRDAQVAGEVTSIAAGPGADDDRRPPAERVVEERVDV